MSIKIFIQITISIIIIMFLIIKRFFKIFSTKNLDTFDILILFSLSVLFFVLSLKMLLTIFSFSKVKSNRNIYITKLFLLYKNLIENNFYTPLKILDESFDKYVEKKYSIEKIHYINNFLFYLYNVILKTNEFTIFNKYFITYFCLKYLPKIIAISFFLLDIFYYQKFYYFYWSLPLLIIPLILRYVKYSLFSDYIKFLDYLELRVEIFDIIPSTSENMIPILSFSEYLEKAFDIHINNKINPYLSDPDTENCGLGLTLTFFQLLSSEQKKYLKNFDYKKAKKRYMRFVLWVEKVHVIYTLLTKKERILDQYINLFIFICYFIGWTYILIISIKDVSYLSLLECSQTDPFSDLIIK